MDDLLELLCQEPYVSGEEVSRRMGITRAAVWKRVQTLREQGFTIQSAGRKGYRLVWPKDALHPAYIRQGLATAWAGRPPMIYEDAMTSTNDVLKQAAQAGAPHGTLAICQEQTAGRGRRGRAWASPRGQGLWASLLLRPAIAPDKAQWITFAAALAMARAVLEATGLTLEIKWPNDLTLLGKKVCGILLEMAGDVETIAYVVVGTGLNVGPCAYPPELSAQAASLFDALGHQPDRAPILRAYLLAMEGFLGRLEAQGPGGLLPAYEKQSCTLGRAVRVQGAGEDYTGVAHGLDDSGALLVRLEDGTIRRVLAGDVSVRGVMGYV